MKYRPSSVTSGCRKYGIRTLVLTVQRDSKSVCGMKLSPMARGTGVPCDFVEVALLPQSRLSTCEDHKCLRRITRLGLYLRSTLYLGGHDNYGYRNQLLFLNLDALRWEEYGYTPPSRGLAPSFALRLPSIHSWGLRWMSVALRSL